MNKKFIITSSIILIVFTLFNIILTSVEQTKVIVSISDNKLTNEGNTKLSISESITGASIAILDPKESLKINQTEEKIYEAKQHE
ncbi:MAG: hypothetical protein HYS32_03210 [Candidatus Woesearchaeota archaeon]|nr:MAG: hypothetical protein HYS32_03210 [Candidatus Woesearchaeota archaeon]